MVGQRGKVGLRGFKNEEKCLEKKKVMGVTKHDLNIIKL